MCEKEKGWGRKEGTTVMGDTLFKPMRQGGGRAGGWRHAAAMGRGDPVTSTR
jgi:hypothetical protein